MATRHNVCINPFLKNDTTGWADGGAESPARQDVTGLGFPRNFAARYTTNSAGFARSASGLVTPGLTYTVSCYIRPTNNSSGTFYIEWTNGSGGHQYSSTSYTANAGTVTRLSHTATAPSGTVDARIVLDGINFSTNTTDLTAVLIEQTASLDTYFDGDSTGGSWDGTNGNSASTLSTEVTGSGQALLGPLVGAASGVRTVLGAAISALGSLVGASAGTRTVNGVGAAPLGRLSATATGTTSGGASTPSAGGSWDTLLAITKEARALAAAEQSRPSVACPNDGEPLQRHRGVLHCAYDGWTAP